MELAAYLGGMTPREMLSRITAYELAEYRALFEMKAEGAGVQDLAGLAANKLAARKR